MENRRKAKWQRNEHIGIVNADRMNQQLKVSRCFIFR